MRKYEYETGRFTSIDPLWNKYYGWTPYQYSMNSPLGLVDFDGFKPTAFEASAMVLHNYGELSASSLPGGWEHINTFSREDGFNASTYSRTSGGVTEYSVSFRGTLGNIDWINNGLQFIGKSSQYARSVDFTGDLIEQLKGSELTALGHSKGGGQAALVSKKFGINAMTFNAAGLSPLTLVANKAYGSSNNIEAYMMSTDPVSMVQNYSPFDLIPNTDGKWNILTPKDRNSFIYGHDMINIYNYFTPKDNSDENTSAE